MGKGRIQELSNLQFLDRDRRPLLTHPGCPQACCFCKASPWTPQCLTKTPRRLAPADIPRTGLTLSRAAYPGLPGLGGTGVLALLASVNVKLLESRDYILSILGSPEVLSSVPCKWLIQNMHSMEREGLKSHSNFMLPGMQFSSSIP